MDNKENGKSSYPFKRNYSLILSFVSINYFILNVLNLSVSLILGTQLLLWVFAWYISDKSPVLSRSRIMNSHVFIFLYIMISFVSAIASEFKLLATVNLIIWSLTVFSIIIITSKIGNDNEFYDLLSLSSVYQLFTIIFIIILGYLSGLIRTYGSTYQNSIGILSISLIYTSLLQRKGKLFKILTLSAATFALLLSQSRTSIIAVLVSLLIYFIITIKLNKIKIMIVITILLLIFFNKIWNPNVEYFVYRVIAKPSSGINEINRDVAYMRISKAYNERLYLQDETFKLIKDNLLFGVGFSQQEKYVNDKLMTGSHSAYLAIIADNGILSFFLIAIYIIKALLMLIRKIKVFNRSQDKLVLCFLIAALIAANGEAYLVNIGNTYSLIILTIIIYSNTKNESYYIISK